MNFRIVAFLLIVNCFAMQNLCAQHGKYFVSAGLGIYEAAFIGTGMNIGLNTRISLAFGSNFSLSDHKFYSFSLETKQQFLPVFKKKLRFEFLIKSNYWIYENQYYNFHAIGFQPGAGLCFSLSSRVELEASLGPIFNLQIKSTRKNYETLGWIKHKDFNSLICLNYHF